MLCDVPDPTLWVIDSDHDSRRTMREIASSIAVTPRLYASPRTFLDEYVPMTPGCLLLEARLPQLSGNQLQQHLLEHDPTLPIVFTTREPDVSAVVEAMKLGAIDYLPKPASPSALVNAIHEALAVGVARRNHARATAEALTRLQRLSPRERQVMLLVAQDLSSKVIASKLHLSVRTVEHHRRSLMEKLESRSVVDLYRLLAPLEKPLTAQGRAAAESLMSELVELVDDPSIGIRKYPSLTGGQAVDTFTWVRQSIQQLGVTKLPRFLSLCGAAV